MRLLTVDFVANFDLKKNNIEGDFSLENTQFDAILEINPAGASWGSITGNIENQTDLKNALDNKADVSTVENLSETVNEHTSELFNITNTINNFGDIVEYNASDFASSQQGEKADTALQPGDNITELVNNANFVNETQLSEGLSEKQDTISDLSDIRSNAENGQSAYTTIQSYGDIVTHNTDEFATSAQGSLADSALQPNDNISELNNNAGYITSASLPTVYNSKITIQKNGVDVDDFTLNQSTNQTVNITVPTDTDDLTNGAGYITSNDLPTVNNPTITFQKNGSTIETITLNQSANETVNFSIPTQASDINAVPITRTVNNKALSANISLDSTDVGALADTTTINDLTTTAQQNALNSGATSTNIGQIATNTSAISTINDKIPSEASSSNQLADKNFVNSSIATNTANFIGTFNSVAELEAYSGTLTNNDYAFVATTDSAGNTLYDRYKYTTATTPASWIFEYELNNSSFTSAQWSAINSGANTTNIGQIATNTNDISDINTTIGGYGDIVTYNASSFATSAQGTKADTALQSGDNVSELTNDANYITSSDLSGYATETWVNNQGFITGINSSDVTNALGYTPYDNTNPDGYITGITSSDVTTALGYTPYNSSNPNGYTSNVGTVTSVNNVSPVSGNVTLSIPSKISDLTDDTSTNPIDKADTLTGLTASITELNYTDGVTGAIQTQINGKQDELVSGTNIKTINNISLLGSGDITISGGGTYTGGTGITIGTGNAINHTNSVTAGTAGTSSATSGSTLAVPYVTYDAEGHITVSGTHTHTVTGFLTSSSTYVASSRFDGQWVAKNQQLMTQSSSSAITISGTQYNMPSGYLPDSTYTYLVKFGIFMYGAGADQAYHINSDVFSTGSTSSTYDFGATYNHIIGGQYSRHNGNIFDLPVGTGRYVKVYGKGATGIVINLYGYRRIGSNS